LILRVGVTGEAADFTYAWLVVNVFMFVFQLMPVPGLDGARILSRFLPPRPREVYMNLDQYLALFILVIFFLLAGPLLSIVKALASGVCRMLAGGAAIC
jgi:Zn-dependent protease